MPAIEVSGLRKAYGSLEAVRGVDFEIEEGEVFGLLGPNGAGKTTTVEILEGYRKRDEGEVAVLGHDPEHPGPEFRERIGVVLQQSELWPNLTVHETHAIFAGYYDRPRDVDQVIELVGLAEKRDARVKTLSGGQKRRLDLGVALVADPDLVFLDEPTTGFDPAARRAAWEMIRSLRSLGKTILLTTHYLDAPEQLADRVAALPEGAFFVFIFPLLLFVLLSSVYTGRYQGKPASWAVLAGILGYGAANTGFAGLALLLVARREMGFLKRVRSTPIPASTYLSAVLTSIVLVFAIQTVALFVLGKVLKSTPFPQELFSFVLVCLLGAAAFAGMGLGMTSLLRSAEGSSAAVNTVLLPMAFLSGGFGPTAHYPQVLRAIGAVLPLKYLIQLIYAVYLHGHQIWDRPGAVAILAAWGLAGAAVAWRRFRWEPVEG